MNLAAIPAVIASLVLVLVLGGIVLDTVRLAVVDMVRRSYWRRRNAAEFSAKRKEA